MNLRGVIGVLLTMSVATWSPTARAQPITTPIFYPNQPLPQFGPGVSCRGGGLIALDRSGKVAAIIVLQGPGIVPRQNDSAILAGPIGALATIARAGDPALGTEPGTTYAITGTAQIPWSSLNLDDDGNLLFGSTLAGPSITTANDFAVYSGPPSALTLFARRGAPAPSASPTTTLGTLVLGRLNAARAAVAVQLAGPDVNTDTNTAIYLGLPAAPQLFAREGDAAPGAAPARFATTPFPIVLPDGSAAFAPTLRNVATNTATIYAGRPGSLALVARVGDQAPDLDPGIQFESFSNLTGDTDGRLFFRAALQGAGSPLDDEALFAGRPGNLRRVLRTRDPIPGLTNVLGVPLVSNLSLDGGWAIFSNRLLNVTNTAVDRVLCLWRDGVLTLLFREGSPVPGLPGVLFGEPGFFTVAADGTALADVQLTGAGVNTSNDRALIFWDQRHQPTRIVREGDSIDPGDGATRTVASFSTLLFNGPGSGLGRYLLPGGKFVYAVEFPDATAAGFIADFRLSIPSEPAWSIPPAMEFNTNSGIQGTEFTPTADAEVTALGYYDDVFSSPPGLNAPHDVGLYDAQTRQLLVSATVPAGTTAPLEGLFRYSPIAPTRLTSGRAYVLAAVATGDNGHNVAAAQMTLSPRIILGPWRLGGAGPQLSFPTQVITTSARFMGPNLKLRPPAPCAADLDDGTRRGIPDGGVTIDDLLYFLDLYAQGLPRADLDDGTATGTPDGGVTIDDLLYFLLRYEGGC